MTAVPEPKPPMKVSITGGPHGNSTKFLINGEPVENARAYTLSAAVDGLTTLIVEYVGVAVEVDVLIDETAFGAENKSYRAVTLRSIEEET